MVISMILYYEKEKKVTESWPSQKKEESQQGSSLFNVYI